MAAPLQNKRILLHAATGGIGTLLIQLAKLMNASQVIATASNESKLELARNLGADAAIDIQKTDGLKVLLESPKQE